MNLLIDFHCHLYPLYDLRKALLFAGRGSKDPKILFLTERHDCSYFEAITNNQLVLGEDLTINKVDSTCCRIGEKIFLVRGRQYAAKEGIEILSLFASPVLSEKLPAKTYCQEIIKNNGIIAFSWAFGKLRGTRSSLIESLALEFGMENVIILDSRLRPSLLALPKIFANLSSKGFREFVGSDPLPLIAHQNKLGSFASYFRDVEIGSIDSESIRKVIMNNPSYDIVGERTGLFEFLGDQIALRI